MWITRTTAATLFVVTFWSTVAVGHETAVATRPHESTVPFVAVIGLSVGVSLLIGSLAVIRCQKHTASNHFHHLDSRLDITALLLALGFVALLGAATQSWPLAVGGGIVGGVVAWFGRRHSLSPHGGCADTALGAILAHRTVEGAVVASIYAASAALGMVGIALLTIHAIAETAAVGGLYAPLGRGWGAATIVAVQLAFVGGALAGGFLTAILSTATVPLLAAVGGVLFVAGVSELQAVVSHRKKHLHV